MKVNTSILALALAAGGLALGGCVVTGTVHEHGYYGDRYGGEVVVVHREPPPVIVERPAPFPGGEVVWVPGYYAPAGAGWVWVGGHYERPPRRGAVWVAPVYERHGADVHFRVGGWH
jgi:hypothetical protein